MSAPLKSLRTLAEHVGPATVAALVAHFGGCHVCIPKTLPPGHRLLDALPAEAAAALVKSHAGETLTIPRNAAGIRAERNQRIRQDRAAGLLLSTIARRHGLSERRISSILKATP